MFATVAGPKAHHLALTLVATKPVIRPLLVVHQLTMVRLVMLAMGMLLPQVRLVAAPQPVTILPLPGLAMASQPATGEIKSQASSTFVPGYLVPCFPLPEAF